MEWHSASYSFGKMKFGSATIREKWNSAIRRFEKITFGWITIRKNVVQRDEVSVIRRFGYVTVRSNYVRWCFFSARQRFGKMLFRQNSVKSTVPSCSVVSRVACLILLQLECCMTRVAIELNKRREIRRSSSGPSKWRFGKTMWPL